MEDHEYVKMTPAMLSNVIGVACAVDPELAGPARLVLASMAANLADFLQLSEIVRKFAQTWREMDCRVDRNSVARFIDESGPLLCQAPSPQDKA